jgi:hypothetical protein
LKAQPVKDGIIMMISNTQLPASPTAPD